MATRNGSDRSSTAAAFGVVALLLAVALVTTLGEHGVFSPSGAGAIAPPLPGVTLDDDAGDRMPIVTSLRSHSEAERRGMRVGDRIDAVDGRQVGDVAALRAAIAKHSGAVPVSLEIQRGDTRWDVALDRAEPPADGMDQPVFANEPENPARRGR